MTTEPKIQLLTFAGCPLAGAARDALSEALAELGLSEFEEVDLLDLDTPEDLRGWGSPTILVAGRDVGGSRKGDAACCRVYSGQSRVPSPATIVASIARERSRAASAAESRR